MKKNNNESFSNTEKGDFRKNSKKTLERHSVCKNSLSTTLYGHNNTSDKKVRIKNSCMRSVRPSIMSCKADMTAMFNRENDEAMRAMNTISNMRSNQAKMVEKYRDI